MRESINHFNKTFLPYIRLPRNHLLPHSDEKGSMQLMNASISPDMMEKLYGISQEEDVSLFTAFLAVFAILILRYSGQPDQIIDLTFRQLLHQVNQAAVEAGDSQSAFFDCLTKELSSDPPTSHSLYTQMSFEMLDSSLDPALPAHLQPNQVETESPDSQVDISLTIQKLPDGNYISLRYKTDLFESAAMERLVGHYQQLLISALANPDEPVVRLKMITPEDWQQLETWNKTHVAYPENETIVSLFEKQVLATPEKSAIRMGEILISYQRLNERANQVASYLHKAGVETGMVVGLCVKRSIEALVALLGILKAGATYLPLDPAYPVDRLEFMLSDSGARIIVGQTRYIEKLAKYCDRAVSLEQEANSIAVQPTTNPKVYIRPGSSLYILYTSGSTGQPKGVTGSHRAAINRFAWMWRTFPFEAEEIACQKTALSFVDSVWELFGPLLQGIPTLIIPDEVVKDPILLVNELSIHGVTRIVLVPSLLNALLSMDLNLKYKLERLCLWVSSGETLPVDLVKRFQNALPHARLINLYGSSEVAGDVTWYNTHEYQEQLPTIPIGRPIDNTTIYVLDPYQNPLPAGLPGEIYAGGANLAIGYYNQPDLTAQKFVADPFSQEIGARLYRTGDMGYFLSDGNIIYLGRRDNQVKIRGMRIELGEIESYLRQHPAIQECAVLVSEQEKVGQALLAYIVVKPSASITIENLRKYLRDALPEFMVPDRFILLDRLPRTPNGKLDRKALPKPESVSRSAFVNTGTARDSLEQQLIRIWEDILNIQPIGREDNFFDLGGHSLLAVKLLSKVQQELSIKIPIMLLFQAPTIKGIAEAIRNYAAEIDWQMIVPIHSHGTNPPFFSVHGVEGGVTDYANLARCLGPEQPFYGLQSFGLDGKTSPLKSVEEMAALYIHAIQSEVQPKGPYFLGGYCFGGLVAYEMACQLSEHGEQVALLAMFETYAPDSTARVFRFLHPVNMVKFLRNSRDWIAEEVARRRRNRERIHRFREEMDDLRINQSWVGLQKKIETTIYPGFHTVAASNERSSNTYQPKLYHGAVDVFRISPFRLTSPLDEDLGWGKYALGGVRNHLVPGSHDTMLELPHVEGLANVLKARIKYFTHDTNGDGLRE